jgi:hypothetical protein
MHPSSPMPLPRTVFLALAAGLSTITTALLAAGPSLHTLYLLSLLAGLSFGGGVGGVLCQTDQAVSLLYCGQHMNGRAYTSPEMTSGLSWHMAIAET